VTLREFKVGAVASLAFIGGNRMLAVAEAGSGAIWVIEL
jgi:hypothetical protein